MFITSPLRPSLWTSLLVCLACGGTTPSPAEDTAPSIAQPAGVGGESTVIEVRVLTIAWAGAEGASEAMTRTEEDARTRAENVAGLLRTPGINVAETARSYGDRPPSQMRISREDSVLPPEVVREAFRTPVGQTSRAVRTDRGFMIVERLPDPERGPSEIRARHILVSHAEARMAPENVTRSRDEARALAEGIARRARAGEDWDEMHGRHSDETNGPPGGDLGRFGRGQMVPSFERAAFRLEVREISDAVESPFGFHVIQRLE
ncbi:MAG: peptidylprolyl isomerase [Myxococcales bacterium]|nr:peptidylprolyl isomerase [Myxococcales bacterium]